MASADTARLIAQLILDDKQFQSAIARSVKGTQKLDSTLSRVGSKAGKGLSTAAGNIAKIGAIGSGIVVGGLVLAVNEASNLNEEINKSTVVFGKASKAVLEFSKTTATSLGISQSEALAAAGAFGNMFNTVGLTQEQSADFSKTLVTLAADMASFNNEDPSEMLDRLRSGLSGEAEPLRRFGVLLSEAAVKEEAYATGIAKRGEALTEAQKVQARYSLILKQTTVQQGDAARTINQFAGQQRVLRASIANTAATIGTALLPKITDLAVKINKLIQENQPAIQKFADQLPAAFDKALAFAEKLPWEQIGKGLETAAFFAGKLVDVFIAMPPEAQTALIALAGLNKLSGGAISGIVGELGKGLIKGVLSMNAAHVTVNAATVSGVGGPGGVAPVGGGGPGKLATAANLIMKVAIVGIAADVAATLQPIVTGAGVALGDALGLPDIPLDQLQWPFGPKNTPTILPEIFGGNGLLGGTAPGATDPAKVNAQGLKQQEALATIASKQNITNERLESIRGYTSDQSQTVSTLLRSSERNETAIRDSAFKGQQAAFAVRDKVAGVGSLTVGAINAAKQVAATTTAAAREAGRQTAFAIRDKDLSVSVANTINTTTVVSVRETIKSTTTHKQYARYLS